jgi:hypothetical protein
MLQNALQWWNLESESKKRKQPDADVGGSTRPNPGPPRTPPNIKVRFEKKFHNGGAERLYGLRISPGNPRVGQDYDWLYFCEARQWFVPLPDGYVPVLDGIEDLDDDF